MNFDLVKRDESFRLHAVTARQVRLRQNGCYGGQVGTVGRAHTPRAEGKTLGCLESFGGRTQIDLFNGSTESYPAVSKLVALVVKAWKISRKTSQASVRSLRGQSFLQHKLEKNGISPTPNAFGAPISGEFLRGISTGGRGYGECS